MKRVFIVGVGMTRFLQPFTHSFDYVTLGKEAVYRAIRDVNIDYEIINEAAVGYVYGDSCSGQRILYEIGQSGIPIYNINNRECSGSSAIHVCYRSIVGGFSDYCLALGFDKSPKKEGAVFLDRADPLQPWKEKSKSLTKKMTLDVDISAQAALEYIQKYGKNQIEMNLAKITEKNYRHAKNNPYSLKNKAYNYKEILNAPMILEPLTGPQCSLPSDGASAILLCSEQFMLTHNLQDQAIEILGISFLTNGASDLNSNSYITLSGYDLTKKTAQNLYSQIKMSSNDIDVCELQDNTSMNELLSYEALAFCPEGQSFDFIEKNLNSYGGKVVINPSGGVIGKGNCLGANGIAQCVELCWQLRGMAGNTQVKNTRVGLQHSLSLGGSCVMLAYSKFNREKGWSRKNQTSDPEILETIEKKEYEDFKRNNERETCPKK